MAKQRPRKETKNPPPKAQAFRQRKETEGAKEPKAKSARSKGVGGRQRRGCWCTGCPAPGTTMGERSGKQPGIPLKQKLLPDQNLHQAGQGRRHANQKAIGLLKQSSGPSSTDREIHMALGIDTTQSEQMIRGSVSLPHGIGKSVRLVVFCQGENVGKATAAGADLAGSDDVIKKIQGGWLDFDVALATQDMMGVVSRLGKVLGPRGLMPTPKAGTVVPAGADVTAAVKEFKAGKVEYRADKGGNVHAGIGKLSFEEDKLVANATTFVDQIRSVKPSGVKGNYVKSITLSATMSPGILVTI